MFSHVTVGSNDVAKAQGFYDTLLKPLGLVRHADYPNAAGYGLSGGRPQLWIVSPLDKKVASVGNGITVGLDAPDRGAVRITGRRYRAVSACLFRASQHPVTVPARTRRLIFVFLLARSA